MSYTERVVLDRLCDHAYVRYLGFRWGVPCYTVNRQTEDRDRLAMLTVLAICHSVSEAFNVSREDDE